MAALLRTRLEGLCEPDDLWLDVVGEEREFWVKSRNTPFEAHTNRYPGRHEEAVVRRGELDRMRYLKAHLLQDLGRARKLFVFKGAADLATIRDVATQLQLYGANTLLCKLRRRGTRPGLSDAREGLLRLPLSLFEKLQWPTKGRDVPPPWHTGCVR